MEQHATPETAVASALQTLRDELVQRDTELSIIQGIHEGMVAKLGFQAIVDLVGERLRATLRTDDIGIRWYEPETSLVHFLFEYERGQRQQIAPRPLARGGTFDQIMKTRKPLVFNGRDDAARNAGSSRPASGESLSWILVPIIGSDQVRGAIIVEDYLRDDAFGETEVRLLTTVTGSMGVALENAQLFDETQRLFNESERRNREDKLRLEIALAQQMELNTLRSSFISMTSHEFRTPLTTIKSSQELLHTYGDRLAAQERGDILKSIDVAVRRMMSMLEQVLTIGRADANLLEFKASRINLAQLCRQLADEAVATCRTQGAGPAPSVALDVELGDDVTGGWALVDEKLLRHALGNLLSNALKYSPRSAQAEMRVRRTGDAVVFEIADSGIGIPEADLGNLFESYHRGANVGSIPGTGLGLAIVKRAVESHGGSIAVTSQPGAGTQFTVRIPQERETTQGAHP